MNAMLTETKGDLFTSIDSLAHCVSRDLVMGKGIAVEFRKRFGNVEFLKKQHKKVGEVAVLRDDDRYIFYLITKQKFNDKPTYENMRLCLRDMANACKMLGVTRLAMPRIGCGLDRLKWPNVKEIIEQECRGTHINVFYL